MLKDFPESEIDFLADVLECRFIFNYAKQYGDFDGTT